MNDPKRSPVPPLASPVEGAAPGSVPEPQRRSFLGSQRTLTVLAVIAGFFLVTWLLTERIGTAPVRQGRGGGGIAPVGVATAGKGEMPVIFQGLGQVTSLATVTVQSQISGQIFAIKFKEGQMVKRGDPLVEIDPRPYQVALEQAEGALARDEALLANARVDLKRYQTLFEQDSIAEQQLATQRALVLQDEGTLKTDHAAIDAAKLNLVYCHITAPVDGLAGLQQVTLGNYVTPAMANGLLVVTELQPITVEFPIPEDNVPEVLTQLHSGQALQATAYNRSNDNLLATGTMATVDSQIDPTTGTLKLKANFANSDLRLFPNQFVNVHLLLNTVHDTVLVPLAAIQRGAPGDYVYVVNAGNKVAVRKVKLGPSDAVNASVTSGLSGGELVVVDGLDRLKDGATVQVRGAPGDAPAGPSTTQPRAGHKHGGKGPGAAPDSSSRPQNPG